MYNENRRYTNRDHKSVMSLEGIKIFEPIVHEDERGHFFEPFSKEIYEELQEKFYQDNHSYSKKHVIRGLHYQWDKPMGKLIRVVSGSIIDYYVDIRKDSKTYGKWDSVLLSANNKKVLWVPPGFAHGFESLEDENIVLYKCTSFYNPAGESGINPFDDELAIPWTAPNHKRNLSEKDLNSKTFLEYKKEPKF